MIYKDQILHLAISGPKFVNLFVDIYQSVSGIVCFFVVVFIRMHFLYFELTWR